VAFTSAPLAHSLPWPDNLEAVRQAETAAREEGASLAVVAVWQGRLTVGLTAAQIEALARGASVLRASQRDLSTAVVRGLTAATTVAASMYLAHRAGIPLLAAGAIGGAARTEGHAWDISADLVALAHTPVAVVCTGARSVLDLAHTAEILESYGIPVVGYRTDWFPIFYQRAITPPNPARSAGGGDFSSTPVARSQAVSARVDSPAQAAALLAAHWGMGGAGMVLAQPTPDAVALSPEELQPALLEVGRLADAGGIRVKDLPTFLLERLNRLTKGRTLRAYKAILEANTRLAAQVAREGQVLRAGDRTP
jgi:pseudouridine-5'-phosphate glycosidase